MKSFLFSLFVKNWPRKLVSLVFAVSIWFLVNQTTTVSKTLTNIPIRIIGLLPEQTVVGLLPTGLLKKRITITITGNKIVVQDLRPNDLEVVIDASGHRESWIASIDKHNLVSLNQNVDIRKQVTSVVASDVFINLTKFITEDITVTIMPPTGNPPRGYEYLDVWPKYLNQKISGPQEQIAALKEQGLELTLNLNKVSAEELDKNYIEQNHHDEVVFKVPDSWKKISVPFGDNTLITLNDPKADFLRILFLKQELMPLDAKLPIFLFFPVKYSASINPLDYSILPTKAVSQKNGIPVLNIPLYVKDVSRLFLDVVKDNLSVAVVVIPSQQPSSQANCAIEFIDEKTLENTFVKTTIEHETYENEILRQADEQQIRHRFREYLRKITLFNDSGKPLSLSAKVKENKVIITEQKLSLMKNDIPLKKPSGITLEQH
ncbi:CdaR family protein [Chlamydiifrater phoenicopteri]|uniref:CdaR family protein n=1 Tax=Chlamydiifrater phoenicopteri TaxID=2681469 RepID=UPI003CCE58D4